MRYFGKCEKAHRISWVIHNGKIPDKVKVLHSCDVTSCVNPSHLYLGSHTDNMNDRGRKDRQAKGTGNASSKITERDVLAIRSLDGIIPHSAISEKFGIHQSQVSKIINRQYWRHV